MICLGMICREDFLNGPELIFAIQLNGFKYCYLTVIILLASLIDCISTEW